MQNLDEVLEAVGLFGHEQRTDPMMQHPFRESLPAVLIGKKQCLIVFQRNSDRDWNFH